MGGGDRFEPWELTPWWHPRRWFGYTVRRWTWDDWSIGNYYDGEWEYATAKQAAWQAIQEHFGREG